jgi:S-adenosylmethionine hydrolase
MPNNPVITLTTDFGYKDPFAGIMKGVILSLNPLANIVDITHGISPQSILEAMLTIGISHSSFPNNTIHIAVIDPGVGSSRRPIIVKTHRHVFVGPDNGIFSQLYNAKDKNIQVFHITSEHYLMPERSATFHGRDIFAPVAAWLSKGIEPYKFGDPVTDYVSIPVPAPDMPSKNLIHGEVLSVDHFGNLVTNITSQLLRDSLNSKAGSRIRVMIKGREAPFVNHYADAKKTEPYSLINSFGYLEIFIFSGNAASELQISTGEKVGVILT